MIDTQNLRTASLYINNQLLSRGLLRDGQSIDFAEPTREDGDGAATMGRIMSVVNDLILRRDRDAEHRESLSTTMRALRSDNLRSTNELSKLTEKNSEAQRKLQIAESSEASLKTQLKSADAAMRGLKDEMARTKALVSQARASCATEVRRRDRQIDTLKRQLGEAGRARGSRGNPAITTITLAAGVGDDKRSSASGGSIAADDYSLRSETNAFLANLAQNLSEDNEALLRVVRKAMEHLREMSGWNGSEKGDSLVATQPSCEDLSSELDSVLDHMRNILTNPSFVPIEEVEVREEEINRLKDGWVKMEDRWQEAVHLIDGWRKRMAASGRPVCEEELEMGLRLSPIRVRDVAETKKARGFLLDAVAEETEEQNEGSQRSPCPPRAETQMDVDDDDQMEQADGNDSDSTGYGAEEKPEDEHDTGDANVDILQESGPTPFRDSASSAHSSPLPEPPQISPLRNSASAGNRGSSPKVRAREKPRGFSAILEENTRDLAADGEAAHPPPKRLKMGVQPVRPPSKAEKPKRQHSPARTSLEDALLGQPETESSQDGKREVLSRTEAGRERRPAESKPSTSRTSSPPRGSSRLPQPRTSAEPAPQQSPLTMDTIAVKLAASERAADAARVRAKLKAARDARTAKKPVAAAAAAVVAEPSQEDVLADVPTATDAGTGEERMEDVDPVKHDPAPSQEGIKVEKRKRDTKRSSKAASRRRSTLSPWELESLMSGGG